MKKKAMAVVLMTSMVIGSSLTVCAAPEIMADGTVFDAEYYAQMYPDVVAALGTDADAMYQHYVTFGQYEGRQAYDGATPLPSDTASTSQAENQLQIIGTQGVVGATYQLPSWGYFEAYYGGSGTDQMIVAMVDTEPDEWLFKEDMERLAPYTTDGYEWRFIHYTTIGEYNDQGRWWAICYWSFDVENSKDWQSAGDDVEYSRKFTVTQDGVDYTECKVAYGTNGQVGEVAGQDGAYFLLPKGYRGKVYFTIKGSNFDGNDTVPNDDAAVTFVF